MTLRFMEKRLRLRKQLCVWSPRSSGAMRQLGVVVATRAFFNGAPYRRVRQDVLDQPERLGA